MVLPVQGARSNKIRAAHAQLVQGSMWPRSVVCEHAGSIELGASGSTNFWSAVAERQRRHRFLCEHVWKIQNIENPDARNSTDPQTTESEQSGVAAAALPPQSKRARPASYIPSFPRAS